MYVRRKTDSPLRLWLFFGLAGICALVTMTVVRNSIHESSEKLQSTFGELRWHDLGRSRFENQQRLRFNFLADDADSNTTEAPASAAAPTTSSDSSSSIVNVNLASSVSDLSPDSASLSASLGQAVINPV